ncbi:hypothetical protein ACQKWADRAFT_292778 [Trichoderma austrokoningii]
MILSAGFLLLPLVSASCEVGYWDCMINNKLDNLGFIDRLSICYSLCYRVYPSDDGDEYDDDT